MKIQWKFVYIRRTEFPNSTKNRIHWMHEFEFVECTKSWKFKGKLCTIDISKVHIRRKIQIHWMYNIEKIQWKIGYIRCTDGPNTWKYSNLLNVWYRENLVEIVYIKCIVSPNSGKKSNSLNITNHQNST